MTFLLAGEPALRNDQPTEIVTLTIPYGSPLKGSVVELRRAWRDKRALWVFRTVGLIYQQSSSQMIPAVLKIKNPRKAGSNTKGKSDGAIAVMAPR
ncbi:hypothetical protein EGH55_12430 [Klebsiella aerogenes]|nr:hypothetical protein EGH55_12430 [Klebsiella aerogenes]